MDIAKWNIKKMEGLVFVWSIHSNKTLVSMLSKITNNKGQIKLRQKLRTDSFTFLTIENICF